MTPSDTPDERYLDGCPSCLARDNPPLVTVRVSAESTECHYECDRCHETWTCSWWEAVS